MVTSGRMGRCRRESLPVSWVRHRRRLARVRNRREAVAGVALLVGMLLLFGSTPGGWPYLPGDLLACALFVLALRLLSPDEAAVDGRFPRD